MPSVITANQGLYLALAVVGGAYATSVALANFLSLLGTKYPACQKAAEAVTSFAALLHNLIAWVTSFVPQTTTGKMRSARRAKSAGFVRPIDLLAVIVFCVCAMFACGILPAAAPAAATLAACVAGVVASHIGLDFEQVVAQSLVTCGGDVLSILEAILASSDPNLAQYKAEAQAAHDDPAKLAALRAKVGHQ